MRKLLRCVYVTLCLLTLQTSGLKMDVHQREALHEGKQSLAQRSDDMPAGVVLLLLCIFVALGLVCIRHIKREWNTRSALEFAKQAGHMISSGGSLTTHKYGSTTSPVLNSQTIDEYIDDSLHRGDNPVMERLNRYHQTFLDYLQATPEPVVFEARGAANVDAFCRNPQIPTDIETSSVPLHHKPLSAGLKRLFNANFERAQQRRQQAMKEENEQEQQSGDEELEYNEIKESAIESKGKGKSGKKESSRKKKKNASKFAVKRVNANAMGISLAHPMNASDFREHDDDESGYDEIMDKARSAYSDSDQELSDDGGDDCLMETKVVVFDTD